MSKPPRFFITPDQVHGRQIAVTGEDLRHIRTVLRKQPGDALVFLDGQGMEYMVRITAVTKSEIVAEIVSEARREFRGPRIILGQGLPKSDKMDFIIQKATELGVSSIVPLITERTIMKVRDSHARTARWQKIAREAAMQSGRPDVPNIERIASLKDFLRTEPALECSNRGNSEPGTLLLLPWEEGTEPIKNVLRQNPDAKNIVVLIGPEGGFSSAEAEMARGKGFHLVSLGPNILRAETAAVAVLGMILYETSSK